MGQVQPTPINYATLNSTVSSNPEFKESIKTALIDNPTFKTAIATALQSYVVNPTLIATNLAIDSTFIDSVVDEVSLKPNLATSIGTNLASNDTMQNIIKNAFLSNDNYLTQLANTLTSESQYRDRLRGPAGTLADAVSVETALLNKTMWCADGICRVSQTNGNALGVSGSQGNFMGDFMMTNDRTKFNRWKVSAPNTSLYSDESSLNFIPYNATLSGGGPVGFDNQKKVSLKYTPNVLPSTTGNLVVNVPGSVVLNKIQFLNHNIEPTTNNTDNWLRVHSGTSENNNGNLAVGDFFAHGKSSIMNRNNSDDPFMIRDKNNTWRNIILELNDLRADVNRAVKYGEQIGIKSDRGPDNYKLFLSNLDSTMARFLSLDLNDWETMKIIKK